MTFTWKRGLGETEEKSKSKYLNRNGNMNQKDWSLSANCPQKIKTMILKQKL